MTIARDIYELTGVGFEVLVNKANGDIICIFVDGNFANTFAKSKTYVPAGNDDITVSPSGIYELRSN